MEHVTRLIVEVRGGVVQAIYSDATRYALDIEVLDWDNFDGETDNEERKKYIDLGIEVRSLNEVY